MRRGRRSPDPVVRLYRPRTSSQLTGARGGFAYKLGQEIGQGGNGIVYSVARRPELVAKIQKIAPSQDEIDKLGVLVRAATPELLAIAAWPMDLLTTSSGQAVGYVMPRILDARPLYELYSPRSRVQHFPAADFRFIVHAAANVARLFAAVHKAGFICGDVNHSNILVRETGTVAAVDCDSFQVGDGARFPCLVGTDLFVPPELMGVSLSATRRTLNHDDFGLAVLIFHLLFMGRHPFAGRFTGRGDMPIERAIAESRYAYSRHVQRSEMTPPPLTVPVAAVGSAVSELFELAFDPASKRGSRPTPETWIAALDNLKSSLSSCAVAPHHHYLASGGSCPWCAIEGRSRLKLFGGLIKTTTAKVSDLESLWARYLALIEPGPPRPLPARPKRQRTPLLTRLRAASGTRLSAAVTLQRLLAAFRSASDAVAQLGRRLRWDRLITIAWVTGFIWLQAGSAASSSWALAQRSFEIWLSWLWVNSGDTMLASLAIALLFVAGPILSTTIGLAGRALRWAFLAPANAVAVRRAPAPIPARIPAAAPRIPKAAARKAWKTAAAAWLAQPQPPDVSAMKPAIEAVKKDLDLLAAEREARIQAVSGIEPADVQLARHLGSLRIEDAKLPNIGPARCVVLRSWGIDTAADIDDAKIGEIPGSAVRSPTSSWCGE